MLRQLAVLGSVVLAAACREGTPPFEMENPFAADSNGHITYNVNGDHAPLFTPSGESIYYVARSYPNLPITHGLLLAVPRRGGVARPILPVVQNGPTIQPFLSGPAVSLDGIWVAFFHVTDYREREFDQIECKFSRLEEPKDTIGTNSFLQEAILRVRRINSTSSEDDAQLTVRFPGRTYGPLPNHIVNIAYPFHRYFDNEGVPFFRPSWSPDAKRVVYSDGLHVYVWTVGQSAAVMLPNTDNGIMPAWSPDGSYIAFSKPFQTPTKRFSCVGEYESVVLPGGVFDRTVYTPITREDAQLWIIKPDGSGVKSLGVGDAPAWTPDSKTIIAHRDLNLVRISVDAGTVTPIANTLNAFEPAVSRDGRYLAFARRTEIGSGELNTKGKYNIWVAPF